MRIVQAAVLLSVVASVISDARYEGGIHGLRSGLYGGRAIDLSGSGGAQQSVTGGRRVFISRSGGASSGSGLGGVRYVSGGASSGSGLGGVRFVSGGASSGSGLGGVRFVSGGASHGSGLGNVRFVSGGASRGSGLGGVRFVSGGASSGSGLGGVRFVSSGASSGSGLGGVRFVGGGASRGSRFGDGALRITSVGGGRVGRGFIRGSLGGVGRQTVRTVRRGGATDLFGSSGGAINVNTFGNFLDTRSYGLSNFAPGYVAIETFHFDNARQAARQLAPAEAIIPVEREQVVVGRRFRSGYARQTETSGASREGSGSGEAGIELTAARTAKQDATQQFTQQATGDGSTSQGAGYVFSRNNDGHIVFQPVTVESGPVHSGPASALG